MVKKKPQSADEQFKAEKRKFEARERRRRDRQTCKAKPAEQTTLV